MRFLFRSQTKSRTALKLRAVWAFPAPPCPAGISTSRSRSSGWLVEVSSHTAVVLFKLPVGLPKLGKSGGFSMSTPVSTPLHGTTCGWGPASVPAMPGLVQDTQRYSIKDITFLDV
jgi:hypothetical protein